VERAYEVCRDGSATAGRADTRVSDRHGHHAHAGLYLERGRNRNRLLPLGEQSLRGRGDSAVVRGLLGLPPKAREERAR